MLRRDKTGPDGKGPLTGRQMGYCSGNIPNPLSKLRMGRGRRNRRGGR